MLTARDVTNQSFTPMQFRHGYDERQVDDFLDQVVETLRYYEQGGRLGEQAPASPARPDFTPATGRRGYDKREVDDFLDQVVETLRYYQRGRSARCAGAGFLGTDQVRRIGTAGHPLAARGPAVLTRPSGAGEERDRSARRPRGSALRARGSGPDWCRPSP